MQADEGGVGQPLGEACPWFVLASLLTVAAAARPSLATAATHRRRHHGGGGGGLPASWAASALPPPDSTHPRRHPASPSGGGGGGGRYACGQAYRRLIGSETDTRFLHIPLDMANALIPDIMAYKVWRPGRKNAAGTQGSADRPVYAASARLVDEAGLEWPVLFRTYVTGRQFHRRLTDGWRPFSRHYGLTAGDAVHFWRREEDECADALVLRVQVVRGKAA